MINEPNENQWIEKVSDDLTDIQKYAIRDAALAAMYDSCRTDPTYMRGIIAEFLDGLDLVNVASEIAGGDREVTAEILGFDPVTGEKVD